MNRKLERFLERYTIEHLTNLLVLLTGLVSLSGVLFQSDIGIITPEMLFSGEWWQILFFPFRIRSDLLFVVFELFILWQFGNILEAQMGHLYYNLYIFAGLLLVTVGGVFFPIQVSASFLHLSIFLGIAYLAPNMEILLLFFIPVRIKWIAIGIVALLLYPAIQLMVYTKTLFPILGPMVGLGNFILFFVPGMVKAVRHTRHQKQRISEYRAAEPQTVHRCTVCGKTELDDPHMDFRYCVECSDHEYCRDHLYNHQHIKE